MNSEAQNLMDEDQLLESQRDAKIKAIDYLARREHSRSELVQKLTQKKFDETLVLALMDELESLGYLSDERYAMMLVRSGYERGHGPMKIRQKAQQKGVSSVLISQAFEEFEADWFELALDVWRRKFGHACLYEMKTQDKQAFFKERSKQMRFLAGRGFSMDQINYALSVDE